MGKRWSRIRRRMAVDPSTEGIDRKILSARRVRADTLAAIERKLREVAQLRSVYANQTDYLDELLDRRCDIRPTTPESPSHPYYGTGGMIR